jgi:hypothetical protein
LKSDIIIYRNANPHLISNLILRDLTYQMLDDNEAIYISPTMAYVFLVLYFQTLSLDKIFGFIGKILKTRSIRLDYIKCAIFNRVIQIYVLSCIQVMQPKVVITMVDTDLMFSWLSENCRETTFFAIQNGSRSIFELNNRKKGSK